jgi:hypothetical protein
MAAKTLSSVIGVDQPRRKLQIFTSSNASVAIPEWAQGGTGIVYVTGCGAGASGALYVGANAYRGGGGCGGAVAIRYPLLIPSGETTLAVTVGAGGAAITAATDTPGNDGSASSVVCGAAALYLLPGTAHPTISYGSGSGGNPIVGASSWTGVTANVNSGPWSATNTNAGINMAAVLGAGAVGGAASSANNGYGAGAWSPFGRGGDGIDSAPSATTNGGDGLGYGSGGAGARWVSGGDATSGAGAPGLIILEFTEGV